MNNEKTTIEKEFEVMTIMKRPININGTMRDKWEVSEPADENGVNEVHDCWSATLAEKIEQGKTVKLQLEQGTNKGGYKFSKVINVANEDGTFPEIKSKSRFQKNYGAMNRSNAVGAAVALISEGYAPAKEWRGVADEIVDYIEGKKDDDKDKS